MSAPEFACLGSIIIDDIVYPDGRTDMGVIGGGVTHTASGMICWDVRPALLASMSSRPSELPAPFQMRLERDFDLRHVMPLDLPQIRGWQIFEWDGRRTEIFRTAGFEAFLVEPTPEHIPEAARGAGAVTILRDAAEFEAQRAVFRQAVALWEPEQHFMLPSNAAAFRAALPLADIVSPNLLEAGLIYGESPAETLVRRMLDDGAPIVSLRMGEHGSLVGARGMSAFIRIPAVPVEKVVDVTGAGNTYCGAFLVGWQRTHDLRLAGCYGTVAASFAVETVGVLDPTRPGFAAERNRRFAWAQANC